jgi:motility quorum-sensing regulator/GCU-specific mRNA interferase toxin
VEKRKPHYRLTEIQDNVRAVGIASFTLTARRNGLAMGLTTEEMVDIVCGLRRVSFYKSMTTHEDHKLWQDVYCATLSTGKTAYIKVTGSADGRAPVIQFKEK